MSGSLRRFVRAFGWKVPALLTGLVVLLEIFQYDTLEKFDVLRPGVRYATLGGFVQIVREYVPLNAFDGVLAALILAVCLGLVVLEVRSRGVTAFLDRVFEREGRTLALLGLGSLVLVRFYFARGEFSWGADSYLHAAYAWISARAFSHGEIPIWTNYFCTGTPFLQFYGFLFFYLVGLVNLALRAPFLAAKCVLAAAHVASGVGMYLLVRSLTGSRRAGFLAGAAFVLTFWHTQQVLVLGRLPVSVVYGLLPWPFYFFEQLRRSRRPRSCAVGGAAALGGLAFAHPGYAFWATAFFVLYAAVRYGQEGRSGFPLRHTLLLFGGGVILGAYLTVPMYLERGNTGLHAGFYMSGFPLPTWRHLLLWSDYRFRIFGALDHWYGGYVGITVFALGVFGLVSALRAFRAKRPSPGLAAGAGLVGSLVLAFGYHWPVLRSLGVVQAMEASRYLLFTVFFLCLLAGTGALDLARRKRRGEARTFTWVLILVLADLGPTTFQEPYQPRDLGVRLGPERTAQLRRDPNAWALNLPLPLQHLSLYNRLREDSDRLPDGELPGYRIFQTTNRIYYHFIIPWLAVNTGVPTPLDTFTQYPLVVPAFVRRFQDLFHRSLRKLGDRSDLESAPEFDLIRTGLFLMNTRYALFSPDETDHIFVREFPGASPIVVSPRAEGWKYPVKALDRFRARSRPGPGDAARAEAEQETALRDFVHLLRAMKVDVADRTCAMIPLRGDRGEQDLGTHPRVEVLEHHVWNQRVELRVRVSAACFARLAYGYYPTLGATVNGRPAKVLETADEFVGLRLEPGENRIVLTPHLSALRLGLLALEACLLAAGTVVLILDRRRS